MQPPRVVARLLKWAALGTAFVGAFDLAHASVAFADDKLELDAVLGAHFFSNKLELGVPDDTMAETTPKDFGLIGLRLSYPIVSGLAVEGEGVLIPTTDSFDGNNVLVIGFRAHLAYRFLDGAVQPFVLGGIGTLSVLSDQVGPSGMTNDTDITPDVGVGVRVKVTEGALLRLDGRLLFPPERTDTGATQDYEVQVAFGFTLGRSKHVRYVHHEEPAPPKDTDGDGIPDALDKCPNDPEDRDGFQDADGCPDPDNDGDGIPDALDKCPNDPETKNGFQDEDGCPEYDRDGDGILDALDKCPDQPEDKDGFEDADGCPDPDNDKDGIPDTVDKCPNQPETYNGYQDADGCPDEVPKEIKKFTGVMEGITYKTDSDEIKKTSYPLLDRAVKVLTQYPDLRVEISGHTDDTGERDHNMDLSHRRAESVKKYFLSKGIKEERIFTIGYGPDKPIGDNKTAKGRQKNRRIEFRLITGEEKPTAQPTQSLPSKQPSDTGLDSKKPEMP